MLVAGMRFAGGRGGGGGLKVRGFIVCSSPNTLSSLSSIEYNALNRYVWPQEVFFEKWGSITSFYCLGRLSKRIYPYKH